MRVIENRWFAAIARSKEIFLTLFVLQGCATTGEEGLTPSIAPNSHWAMSASSALIYREALFGPRLFIIVRPVETTAAQSESRIELVFANGFDSDFALNTRQIDLQVEGRRYAATGGTCISRGHSAVDMRADGVVLLHKHQSSEPLPCLSLMFHTTHALQWETATLAIFGLAKRDVRIAVPDIGFRKIKRRPRGGFS